MEPNRVIIDDPYIAAPTAASVSEAYEWFEQCLRRRGRWRFRFVFDWSNFWIGFSYDKEKRGVMIFPVPMLGVEISFPRVTRTIVLPHGMGVATLQYLEGNPDVAAETQWPQPPRDPQNLSGH